MINFDDYEVLLKKLKYNKFFNLQSDTVYNQNFRISIKDFIFPSFDVKEKCFGQNIVITKIDNFKINNIEHYMSIIEDCYYDNLFVKNSKNFLDMEIDGNNGLSFIGFFEDSKKNFYFVVSSKPKENFLRKYIIKGKENFNTNIELRKEVLKRKKEIDLKTFVNIEQEFYSILNAKQDFFIKDKFSYIKNAQHYLKESVVSNIAFSAFLIEKINEKTTVQIKPISNPIILEHFKIEENYENCFCKKIVNSSPIFYNIEDGIGHLENDNTEAFLIPTILFNNNKNKILNKPTIDFRTASKYNLENYCSDNFLKRELCLDIIKNYAENLKLKKELIYEKNQLKPIYLFLA